MNNFVNLLEKHIDFHFALAVVAILGTAGSLYIQFVNAGVEFEALNGSIYSVARSRETMDDRESATLNRQLEQIENELNALNLN